MVRPDYNHLALLPVCIYFLFPYLWGEKGSRNRKILFMLFALWSCDLLIHFGDGFFNELNSVGRIMATDILVGFVLLIGGRVLPFFRAKALATSGIDNLAIVEKLSGVFFVLFVLSSLVEFKMIRVFIAGILFILQLVRWWHWKPLSSFRPSILGVLYLGYFWLILGFLTVALSRVVGIAPTLSTHLFTAGGLGVVMFAMMVRVSLGHSGRPIKSSRVMFLAYIMVNIAVVARAILPIFWAEKYLQLIQLSGVLWVLAFLLFFFNFFNILRKPRPV